MSAIRASIRRLNDRSIPIYDRNNRKLDAFVMFREALKKTGRKILLCYLFPPHFVAFEVTLTVEKLD